MANHEREVRRVQLLLRKVPASNSRDWNSAEGRKFCQTVRELNADGLSIAWLADQLGMTAAQLYNVLSRNDRRVAG